MKKIEDFLNDRLPHAGLLPHSLMHSVAPLVLGLFVACLVTLSCNTSDVLIESFELLLLFDPLFMILSRYSFQYVVFKVRGTPQAKLLSANGDGEIRTLDPLLARQVLSQLSYTPIGCGSTLLRQSLFSFAWFDLTKSIHMDLSSFSRVYVLMGLSGLEPPTSRLSGVRSNQLSYKPIEIFRSLWCFQLSLDN